MSPEDIDENLLYLLEKCRCWKCCEVWGTHSWSNPTGEKCMICHNIVKKRIRIPSSTAYEVCYDCYSFWVEGYTHDELLYKIKKHYRTTNN